MKKYFGLLEEAAERYHILRGQHEAEQSWKARIVYTILGQTGLSALWDSGDDREPVSVVRLKRRITGEFESLMALYPDIKNQFLCSADELCEEIYNNLAGAGCLYHSPSRLVPSVRREATAYGCRFMRGLAPDEKCQVSGLGSYLPGTGKETDAGLIRDMFLLQDVPLPGLWELLVSAAKWSEAEEQESMEFLRMKPPFTYGYWQDRPDPTAEITLLRLGKPGGRLYYLYRAGRDESRPTISQLPAWLTEEQGYMLAANACISAHGTLPQTLYKEDGGIVQLRLQYLYPPQELAMMKLYSWPASYSKFPHDFNRLMTSDIFAAIQHVLEGTGLLFKEEGA